MIQGIIKVSKVGNSYVAYIPNKIAKVMNYKVGDLINVAFEEPIGKVERKKKKRDEKEKEEEKGEYLPEL